MKTKVKICGIRSRESSLAAVHAEADFIGFNFVKDSPRYINPHLAKEIIVPLKGKINIVGVFQNADVDSINRIIDFLKLDYTQLHGEETKTFAKKIKAKIIKVFIISMTTSAVDVGNAIRNFKPDLTLLDVEKGDKQSVLDRDQAKFLSSRFPILIAGGLNNDNVKKMIKSIKPFGVDVASGIETDGKEDLDKITLFIKNAKQISL